MAIWRTRPEIRAGPIWRARKEAKVRSLMGSWLPRPPRPAGAGSSWANAATDSNSTSETSFIGASITYDFRNALYTFRASVNGGPEFHNSSQVAGCLVVMIGEQFPLP